MEGSILAVMNLKGIESAKYRGKSQLGHTRESAGADRRKHGRSSELRKEPNDLPGLFSPVPLSTILEAGGGVSVVEIKAPRRFAGKTLLAVDIRKTYGATVLAIIRAPGENGKQERLVSPTGDDMIQEGDTLLIFGPDNKLDSISQARHTSHDPSSISRSGVTGLPLTRHII